MGAAALKGEAPPQAAVGVASAALTAVGEVTLVLLNTPWPTVASPPLIRSAEAARGGGGGGWG